MCLLCVCAHVCVPPARAQIDSSQEDLQALAAKVASWSRQAAGLAGGLQVRGWLCVYRRGRVLSEPRAQ